MHGQQIIALKIYLLFKIFSAISRNCPSDLPYYRDFCFQPSQQIALQIYLKILEIFFFSHLLLSSKKNPNTFALKIDYFSMSLYRDFSPKEINTGII